MAQTMSIIFWIATSMLRSRRMSLALFLSLSYLSRVHLLLPGTLQGKWLKLIHLADFKTCNIGHVINVGSISGRRSYVGASVTKRRVNTYYTVMTNGSK